MIRNREARVLDGYSYLKVEVTKNENKSSGGGEPPLVGEGQGGSSAKSSEMKMETPEHSL